MIHPYYDVVQFKCDSMQYDPMEKNMVAFISLVQTGSKTLN